MAAEPMEIVAKVKFEAIDAASIAKAITSEMQKVSGAVQKATSTGGEKEEKARMATYGDIRKPLQEMVLSLTTSLGNALKGAGMGSAAGGIVGIIQLVAGEMVEQLVGIVQGIVKLVSLFTLLGIPLMVIAGIFTAFWAAFRTVTKVWNVLLEAVTRIVEPFANLLIPLLIPFLYIASMMARMVNMVVMPIFALLMKALAPGSGAVMQAAMAKIMGGDLMGGLMIIVNDLGAKLAAMKDQIVGMLMPLWNMLAGWILSFLTLDLTAVHDVVNNLLGTQLGGIVNGMIDMGYKFISGIAGFLAQIVGKDVFNQMFGEGKFEEISKTNEGFAGGANLAKIIQDLWKQLKDFLVALEKDPIATIWTTFTTGVNAALAGVLKLIEDVTGLNLPEYWTTTIKPALEGLVSAVNTALADMFGKEGKGGKWQEWTTAIDNLVKALQKWAELINAFNPATQFQKAIDQLTSLLKPEKSKSGKGGGGGGGAYGDFIMRPGQGATNFSPEDTIFGMKNPRALGGGGSTVIVNNTWNVSANSDRQVIDLMKQTIEQHDAQLSRAGYFQQGR